MNNTCLFFLSSGASTLDFSDSVCLFIYDKKRLKFLIKSARDYICSHQQLVFENLLFRNQLSILQRNTKRLRLQTLDRVLSAQVSRLFKKKRHLTVTIVKPDAVIRWYRRVFSSFSTFIGENATHLILEYF